VETVKRLLDILDLKQTRESAPEGDSGVVGRWMREKYEKNSQTVLGCKKHLECLQQSTSSQLQTVSATPVNACPERVSSAHMSFKSRLISSPTKGIADGLKQTARTCSQ
jgi:hypothetical protein